MVATVIWVSKDHIEACGDAKIQGLVNPLESCDG